MYCEHLIDIIKKLSKINKILSQFKKSKAWNGPQTKINNFMPSIGESAYNQEKAAKMGREGEYMHNVDINVKAKKEH